VTFGVLAATSSSISGVAPGALGFLIVAGIGVALVFLLRSMNKQFRKIAPGAPGAAAPSASASTSPSAFASAEDAARADGSGTGPSNPS
jgi:hypothetical protein